MYATSRDPPRSELAFIRKTCPRRSIYISYLVGRTGFEPVTSSVSGLFQDQRQVLQPRSAGLWACPRVTVTVFGRPPDRARGGHELLMVRLRA